jgi:hypothetical protein
MKNEKYFDLVLHRLKVAAEAGTDADIAKLIGMSPQALNNRKKAGSLPNTEIVDFCNKHFVDLNFVYRGEKVVTVDAHQSPSSGDTLRFAIEELQAWQVREKRFLSPEKFSEAVFTLCELAEDKPERVKAASAMVLRLVA